jgi:hypothetical protein
MVSVSRFLSFSGKNDSLTAFCIRSDKPFLETPKNSQDI